jgi:ADP-ribosylglycohydrolase
MSGENFMNRLFDKIYGCIAASNIGSAMGAPVEGWSTQSIREQYGVLKELLPYAHYEPNERGGGRLRPAGTTEDGIERQRLMCTAIIEKRDRITPEDLAKVIVRDVNPDIFGVQMEPSDEMTYRVLKAGIPYEVSGYPSISIGYPCFIPAADAGRYTASFGTVGFARSCHPIGIINAANPEQAFLDAIEIGKLYMPSHDVALFWAGAVAAAIAEALKPQATVGSVVETVQEYVPHQVWDEMQKGLAVAERCENVLEMPEIFNPFYCNISGFHAMCKAHEVVTKGFAIFQKANGKPKESIIGAVNFGRDTDCLAAVAGGIAGALTGASAIPDEWIQCVDEATKRNEYTVSRRTLKETSQGLYEALQQHLKKQRERWRLLEADIEGTP